MIISARLGIKYLLPVTPVTITNMISAKITTSPTHAITRKIGRLRILCSYVSVFFSSMLSPSPQRFAYSYRSASIGFRFDALTEGINPNTIPITIEKITEIAIAAPLIATGTDATSEIR